MKKAIESVLKKQISIKTLLAVLLVLLFAITAIAATYDTVQATLASHFTITYNGEAQTFHDANGKVVYPLVYEGTTYLPVRATTAMLGLQVDWLPETNTVALGGSAQKPTQEPAKEPTQEPAQKPAANFVKPQVFVDFEKIVTELDSKDIFTKEDIDKIIGFDAFDVFPAGISQDYEWSYAGGAIIHVKYCRSKDVSNSIIKRGNEYLDYLGQTELYIELKIGFLGARNPNVDLTKASEFDMDSKMGKTITYSDIKTAFGVEGMIIQYNLSKGLKMYYWEDANGKYCKAEFDKENCVKLVTQL
jgi:hypothetical protein